ncbi:MAG TPA: 2'-5' RNA ligase family protein [Longilinea sp.]|nr:2'-5' RNA ligase family protein [Longilinea sp.]
MYALTTLFDLESNAVFARMWQKLKNECHLVPANEVSFVHLSWQGASGYQLESAQSIIHKVCTTTRTFPVKVSGIGIFTGPEPVLYLNVVKDQALMDLHNELWDKLSPFAEELNGYYGPSDWVPHITLAYGTLLPVDLACAVTELMYEPFSIDLVIDNLALIFSRDGTVGIDSRYELLPS